MNEAKIVGTAGEMRKQTADPGPGLAVLTKFIETLHQAAGLTEKAEVLAFALECLSMHPLEFRLVIECVQMTDTAGAEDLHHPFGPGGKMWWSSRRRSGRGPGVLAIEQPRKS